MLLQVGVLSLSDCDYYKDPDFLKKFEEQLYYIFEENAREENNDKLVANVDTMLYTKICWC